MTGLDPPSNHSRDTALLDASVAGMAEPTGRLYAVGGSMYVFLFSLVWPCGGAVRRRVQPIDTSCIQGCQSGLHKPSTGPRSTYQGILDFHVGISVFLRLGIGELCPVSTNLDYVVRRGPMPGPFFTFADSYS